MTSRRTGFYVLRDTGGGAYVEGPFKTASAAQARRRAYEGTGWKPVVLRATSRQEAVNRLAERLRRDNL